MPSSCQVRSPMNAYRVLDGTVTKTTTEPVV